MASSSAKSEMAIKEKESITVQKKVQKRNSSHEENWKKTNDYKGSAAASVSTGRAATALLNHCKTHDLSSM